MNLANTYSNYCLIPSLSHEKTAAEPSSGMQHNGRITLPELQPPVRVNPTFTESHGSMDGNLNTAPYKSIRERGLAVETVGWSLKKMLATGVITALTLPWRLMIDYGLVKDAKKGIEKKREGIESDLLKAEEKRVNLSEVQEEFEQYCSTDNDDELKKLIDDTTERLKDRTDAKIRALDNESGLIDDIQGLRALEAFFVPNKSELLSLLSSFISVFLDLRTIAERFSKSPSVQKAYEAKIGDFSFEFKGNQYCLKKAAIVVEALILEADGSLTIKVPEIRGEISRKNGRSQEEGGRFIVDFDMTIKAPLGREFHKLLICDATSIPSVSEKLQSMLSDVDSTDVSQDSRHEENSMDNLVDCSLNHLAFLPPCSNALSLTGEESVELVLKVLSPLVGFGLTTQRDTSTSKLQKLEQKKQVFQEEQHAVDSLLTRVLNARREVKDQDSPIYTALSASRLSLFRRANTLSANLYKTGQAIKELANELAIPWLKPGTSADLICHSVDNISRLLFGVRHAFGSRTQRYPIQIRDQDIPFDKNKAIRIKNATLEVEPVTFSSDGVLQIRVPKVSFVPSILRENGTIQGPETTLTDVFIEVKPPFAAMVHDIFTIDFPITPKKRWLCLRNIKKLLIYGMPSKWMEVTG